MSDTPGRGQQVAANIIVESIAAGVEDGFEFLRAAFAPGLRCFLVRRLRAEDAEDALHDVLIAVVGAIKRGRIRQPDRLPGFVHTVARRIALQRLEQLARRRNLFVEARESLPATGCDAERLLIDRECAAIIVGVLDAIPPRRREVLVRFFFLEQTDEQIRREMKLTKTQLRLLKSRAKDRFLAVAQRRLASRVRGGCRTASG